LALSPERKQNTGEAEGSGLCNLFAAYSVELWLRALPCSRVSRCQRTPSVAVPALPMVWSDAPPLLTVFSA